MFLQRDNPFYVCQYMTGQTLSGTNIGDPAQGNMIPFAQYLSNYTFATVGGGQFSEHFVTIIAEDADVNGGTILLDGVVVPVIEFSPNWYIRISIFPSTVGRRNSHYILQWCSWNYCRRL